VFKALGTTLPASSPPRATYMFRDVSAWARDYGIPFQLPEVFPVNAIKAMRSVLAVPDADASWNLALSIFKAYWGEGRDISRPDVISELVGAVGLNAADVLAATERQDIKDTLRGNGEEALARGAFGAPTIFVGEQMFVGNDRLPFVERAARGEQVYP
jgi:2-hydroxychromene-2-carboxylate isomerase